jgi:hypothetical protein
MEINKEIKEDLQRFENLIKMINFDYTQFFAGNIKHPPVVHEREANAIIKKYNMHQIINTTLRFKFNKLVARYLTFREKWKRKMLEFEGVKNRLLLLQPKLVVQNLHSRNHIRWNLINFRATTIKNILKKS